METKVKKESLVRVITPKGYLSYPHLAVPSDKYNNYSAGIYISAEEMALPEGVAFQKAVIAVMRRYAGVDTVSFKSTQLPFGGVADFRLENTDTLAPKDLDKLPKEIKEGKFFVIKTANKFAVPVMARDGKTKLSQEQAKKLKGGELVRFQIDLNPYTPSGTKTQSMGYRLMGVQYIAEAYNFSAGEISTTFESVEVPVGDFSQEPSDDLM